MGSASTLLMLRTIAVWNRSPRIVIPLILASMGQWGLLIHGIVTIRSQWSDVERTCLVKTVSPKYMEAIFMYCKLSPQSSLFPSRHMGQNEILMSNAGVLFDLAVLVLTTTGLYLSPARSSLWQLLFRQGIIYFVAAFVANMIPSIFLLLNLNCAYFLLPPIPHGDFVYEFYLTRHCRQNSDNEYYVQHPCNSHHIHRFLPFIRLPHQLHSK